MLNDIFRKTRETIVAVATLMIISALYAPNAHAKDIVDEIYRQQKIIQKTGDQVAALQKNVLSSDQTEAGSKLTPEQLGEISNILSSTSREFASLARQLVLANLVTDQRLIPHARKIIEQQKRYMVRSMTSYGDAIKKVIFLAGDQETARLLLEARDLLQSSAELVNRVSISEKRK